MIKEKELPDGWEIMKLKYVAKVSTGQSAPQGDKYYENGLYPFVRAGDLSNNSEKYVGDGSDKINEIAIKECRLKLFSTNTIVFPKSGMSAMKNNISILKNDCYVVSHLATLRIDNLKANYKYVFYLLKHFKTSNLIKNDAYPSIRTTDIEKLEIALPPLPIQKRIVTVLEKSEKAKEWRKDADEFTKDFLESVFFEMFGDPIKNKNNFEIRSLKELTLKITDGTHKTPKYQSNGVNFLSAKNIINNELSFKDIKYIRKEEHKELIKRCNPEKGDILLTKSGSIGSAAIINSNVEFSVFESLALLKIDNQIINPDFLKFFLNNSTTKQVYNRSIKGVAIRHLHLVDIRSLSIIYPPIELQKKFSKIVEELEILKDYQKQSKQQIDDLFNALMQKAFKGELV